MNTDLICALVVVYEPCFSTLDKLVSATRSQVSSILLIDNSESLHSQESLAERYAACEGVEVLSVGENLGLGSAQNIGIQWAESRGMDGVLILDQDSVPGNQMVALLAKAISEPGAQPIAAVGPSFCNPDTGYRSAFIRFGRVFIQRLKLDAFSEFSSGVDFLISSGSLICLKALKRIGYMDESLFIDHIDTDWCLRARAAGHRLLGVPSATMEHCLGDDCLELQMGKTIRVPVRKPYRSYYCFRNSIILYRKGIAPAAWKVNEFFRLCSIAGVTCLFLPEKALHMKMMFKGLRDGLLGINGKTVAPF